MAARGAKQRIVSLAPSATSILIAIGARDQLVGVSKWCGEVADVNGLPRLGDCWSLETEQVAALKPDIVIGSVPYKQEAVAKLLEQPVAFLAMNPRSLAGVYGDILLLGRIAGRGAVAKQFVAKMRGELEKVRRGSSRAQRSRRKNAPRVYCEAWPHPRISSPPWVAELVEIAGGRMCVAAGVRVSEAQVAEAAPEIIVLAWTAMGAKSNMKKAYEVVEWRDVPAIRNERVYAVSDELLNTPGPPLVAGARKLAELIVPAPDRRANR